jgi:repressor LexA
MGRKPLFDRNQVLEVINRWLIRHGVPPTVEELRRALRAGSTRTILRYLEELEEANEIERWPGARGLRVLKSPGRGLRTRAIPLVGEIPAGPMMLAEENIEAWVRLPEEYLPSRSARFFLLRVRGDSMNRARVAGGLIENGDLVVVHQRPAEAGDIVVALIDGEATLKRLTRGPGYAVLKPESRNAKHQPIVAGENLIVQGVVKRVLKRGTSVIEG